MLRHELLRSPTELHERRRNTIILTLLYQNNV